MRRSCLRLRLSMNVISTQLCRSLDPRAGFEPALTASEAAVLPLDDLGIGVGGSPGNRTPPYRVRAGCSALELKTRQASPREARLGLATLSFMIVSFHCVVMGESLAVVFVRAHLTRSAPKRRRQWSPWRAAIIGLAFGAICIRGISQWLKRRRPPPRFGAAHDG